MSDQDQHDIATCTRAWQMLRMAHDRVAQRLGAELSRECALAINEFDVLLYLRSHANERCGSVRCWRPSRSANPHSAA